MKRIVIFINLMLTVCALWAQPDSNLYSFFVAGHTYGNPGVNNVGFHPPFRQKFTYIQNRPEIKFGVLTGDIVYPNPNANDWNEIDADIDSLGLPVYFAVGNHDMENRTLFESRYGKTYYSFIYQNDLFIILDPNIDEWNISGEQLQFLQNVVNDNYLVADNIYVFFHQILWRETDNQFSYILWNSDAGRGDSVNFWTEVEPIFRVLPNEVFMFAGDLGASWSSNVTYDKYANITLISSGMGDEDGENFIVINVDSNKSVSYDLICLSDTSMNCLGMLTDHLVVDELVGITDPPLENSVNSILYPNPATNSVTVEIYNDHTWTAINFFNSNGQSVFAKQNLKKFKHDIDLTSMDKGIYLVQITNDFTYETIKLIVQ